MGKKNFFKFNFIHPALGDFSRDLERSQQLYNDSYQHLNHWDEVEKLRMSGDEGHFQEVIIYYRDTCQLHADMQLSHTNLLISYYAFRSAANKDSKVMEEFKKMPANFSAVDKQFTTLLEGYQEYVSQIRKLI